MDLYKIFLCISALILLNEVDAGKKRRKHHPVKPLFGVGIGFKRVVKYHPVLIFEKHKHHRPRYHRPHGWGGWGWPMRHHGGGHGGGHHGGGHGGHKGHGGHGKGHNHQHYHHHQGYDSHRGGGHGGGWEMDEGGYGWGDDQGYDDPHEHYGGWESRPMPTTTKAETPVKFHSLEVREGETTNNPLNPYGSNIMGRYAQGQYSSNNDHNPEHKYPSEETSSESYHRNYNNPFDEAVKNRDRKNNMPSTEPITTPSFFSTPFPTFEQFSAKSYK